MNSVTSTPEVVPSPPVSRAHIIPKIFVALTVLAYFLHLGLNNIWTPNESFYAEAVREMLESGNYLDIFYNYEPRFNKPPLLYWLMALSANLFGLSEWAIRLPVAILGLGAVYLTYLMGKLLDNERLGILAAAIMAFSFHFVINARYGSPAVPLTFFFSLTVYLFLKGYLQRSFIYVLLSYVALGFTILMKGYPYLIVISLIIGVYVLLDSHFRWRNFWTKIAWLKPWLGLPIALGIGMSWIIYMGLTYGQEFYEVFITETYGRAFTRKASLKPFFYLEANLWGFLAYSIPLFTGLGYLLVSQFRDLRTSPALRLGFSWFIVMLIVFTIAKGKIPTYFIQGHPGMSLMTAFFILRLKPIHPRWKVWYNLQFWMPGIAFTLLSVVIIFLVKASFFLYPLAILPLAAYWWGKKQDIEYLQLPYLPFTGLLNAYLLFALLVLPQMEIGYRNQDAMGAAIRGKVVDTTLPIMVEEFNVHNLPYYAERRVEQYQSFEDISEALTVGPGVVLIPSHRLNEYPPGEEIWRGLIYENSETRTLMFLLDTLKHERGEATPFVEYSLVAYL